MYKIKVHKRINQTVNFYRLIGMFPINDESKSVGRIRLRMIYLILHVFYFTSLILGSLLSGDINDFIFLINSAIQTFVGTVKTIYILWKMNEICAFIVDIGPHSIADYENFVKVNEKIENLMTFSSGFLWLLFVNILGLGTFHLPAFSSEHRLPIDIWFPFDWKNNKIIYWIAYVFVVTGCTNVAISLSLNIIMWYLMMNCAIKYQVLGNQFKNMFSKQPSLKNRQISKSEKENLVLQQLIELIKSHRRYIKKINQLKSCFENLFFTLITTSGISICGSVFSLAFGTLGENAIQSMVQISFLIHNVFDIFMVMHFGNEIRMSSDRLSYCLFKSNWLEQSQSCRKCVIILTEALKQPQQLIIYKVYPLEMETFNSIIKLAYSAFNILKNFN